MPDVPVIQKGEAITANYLNDVGEKVNGLQAQVTKAKDDLGKLSVAQAAELVVGESSEVDITWIELSREESTVRIENPDDATQYVDVLRMDTVTMQSEDGTVMQLIFNPS